MSSRRHVPRYRKHRPSGQAVVTLSGRDFYLGKYGTKASHAEWIANGRRLPQSDDDDELLVSDVILRYWKQAAEPYYSGGEMWGIKATLRRLRKLYGHTKATDFGPLALKSIRQKMIDEDLSRGVINANVRRIRRMFRWAASEEMVSESIHRALGTVPDLRKGRSAARETEPVKPVDDVVVDATLPHLPVVVADMVRFQRCTGIRPGELCSMRPADVDRSKDIWTYTPARHKTEHFGHERVIYVGPKAQVILKRYLLRSETAPCFSPVESESKRLDERHGRRVTPISCGNRPGSNRKSARKRAPSDAYTTASYRRAIDRACKKAGVESWAPNRIRHRVGTDVRREFGLEAAQVALGHSCANVTQVYAERNSRLAEKVARAVG